VSFWPVQKAFARGRALRQRAISPIHNTLAIVRTNVAWTLDWSTPQRHNLSAPLIVSLTSYPKRFRTVGLTIKCLLSQTIAPDAVLLWIAHADKDALPADVLALQKFGLTIECTEDCGSYTKIIPTLRKFPDSFIATADDDLYYWPTWLEELVDLYSPSKREIVCHRVHKIRLGADGLPAPYAEWHYEYKGSEASPLIFPTGVGGVLYPPGHLHPDVLDEATFRTLCPSADDVWLYWMGLRGGSLFRKTGQRHFLRAWPGSQAYTLHKLNVPQGGGNDKQIGSLINRYGFLPTPHWVPEVPLTCRASHERL
jgi:hypothetical protein